MSQDALRLARQGDAQAIAFLISQALEPRGVRVRAMREQSCLHVLLEAAQVPKPDLARFVRGGIVCLGTRSIESLRVYGRQLGMLSPDWTQEWTLVEPSSTPSAVVEPPAFSAATATAAPARSIALKSSAPRPAVAPPPAPTAPVNVQRSKQRTWQRVAIARAGLLVPLAFSAGLVVGAGWNKLFGQPEPDLDSSPADTLSRRLSTDRAISLPPPTVDSPTTVPQPERQPERSPTNPLPPAAANAAQPALTIKAVGDIIPGTNFPGDRLPAGDGMWLFDNVKAFFDGADILFGNFESTLTDHPDAAKDVSQGQTFAFRSPPSYANVLQQLGFDVLSVANNHSFDFGDQGFSDTIANIRQAGMQAVGQKNEIVYTETNGVTVAFIGFSYFSDHNSMLDLDSGRALVDQAKQQADIVVISVHAGAEGSDASRTLNESESFFGENRGNMVEFSHAMIDQGADLILGHGPHVPRALELYKSRLIAYSLGNFVGYRTLSTDGTLGYSLILDAQLSNQGEFLSGRIIPVQLDAQGVPYIDDNFTSVSFIRNLIETDFPVTPLLIDEAGQILRNEAPLPSA
jgi:hypothetical protein